MTSVDLKLTTTFAPINSTFVNWLLDVATTNGRLTTADRISFDTLIQRPRHASTLSNWRIRADDMAAPGMIGNHSQSYGSFVTEVLEPLKPWLAKETEERQAREKHLRAVALQHADAAAVAAGLPTRAEQEAIDAQAARDAAYLGKFPVALPEPLKDRYLSRAKKRRALDEVEKAHRYSAKRSGNLIEKG